MTRPPLKTRMLGHPMAVLPTAGITLWSVYAVTQDSQVWPLTALLVVLTGIIMKANEQVTAYAAWKRAWDGMAPATPERAATGRRKLLLIPAVAAMILYLAAHAEEPGYRFALGWLVIGGAMLGIGLLVRRWRRRGTPRPGKADIVSICITRPLLPVPTVADAYRALPAHCRQILSPART